MITICESNFKLQKPKKSNRIFSAGFGLKKKKKEKSLKPNF